MKIALGYKALLALSVATAMTGCGSEDNQDIVRDRNATIDLRLMETTDLHGTMMPFNYFDNKTDSNLSLARAAVIIRDARDEVDNSMLFDNGDLIQGSPMADYVANLGLDYFEKHGRHPVYKAMNLLDYDAANIGNHEFNYGIAFMEQSIEGAEFPYVVSNVWKYDESVAGTYGTFENTCSPRIEHKDFYDFAESAFNTVAPYEILDRTFKARNGESYTVKVGVIGFTPPGIMGWDKSHLECEVLVSDIKTTAEYYVPRMLEDGADIIVAVPHSGLSNSDNATPFQDNATWELAQIDGIDAIMFGHDHNNFPTDAGTYDGMEGVNGPKGTIFGKPAVMPGSLGDKVGVIDLVIQTSNSGDSWVVNYPESSAQLRGLPENPDLVADDIVSVVKADHDNTVSYMEEPIVAIEQSINSFFSAVEPDLSIQIVNEAQFNWGVKQVAEGNLAMEEEAILISVSAPFKGGRDGNHNYTNIDGDVLTNASVADLYNFDNNTPAVLKLTAADVKKWLEAIASQQYRTVAIDNDDLLFNEFDSYNFDAFYGGWNAAGESIEMSYTIDVGVEPGYKVDDTGGLIYDDNNQAIPNDGVNRISNLTYDGTDVDDEQIFYVVTNNYRATNTNIPGVGNATLVLEDAAYSNRELVSQYLQELAEALGGDVPLVRFENMNNYELAGPTGIKVQFLSGPAGQEYSNTLDNVTWTEDTGSMGDKHGYSVYLYSFD
ncbi:2,' 3'-cyclic nucleotide 2'-phosphodiesterase [Vibrio sp. 10N.286.49.C2]|uniref:bifunctional 2',3'-cyclic-nucleotide 2'-phosphodiesterase/3'-nucleotidase n=1 Tax=unclassified Vibrio TaxID=2614977 RepID=UPI000CB2A5F7|nr:MULTISPECIES: bifunctional 2',3'-cyclic-nucleotide 2'-phosphodiesterase/3'-nucleotidase [unclassified Vibrio]PMH30912.1 2,' 3'-cyclic nucleotide 2'-phosphodiesterase [Vibrio sp. 10N.286.49.C2]PMH48150.1 2,' 3'-cyclic nucleotide 2'-phosphodiesterase [Vibrio sp. 10N.286.49.B1]PMH78347.1 2,' 3'-cyclic nucleotide 2'-phosphodiesterase [Vibrio sp. 10N.286.48.B7]